MSTPNLKHSDPSSSDNQGCLEPQAERSSNLYQPIIQLAIIIGCLVFLYFHVAQGLVSDWLNLPDFSHGFLIPIVSMYFVYERRKQSSAILPIGQDWD